MNSSKAEHEEDSYKTNGSLEVNDLNEAPKELASVSRTWHGGKKRPNSRKERLVHTEANREQKTGSVGSVPSLSFSGGTQTSAQYSLFVNLMVRKCLNHL